MSTTTFRAATRLLGLLPAALSLSTSGPARAQAQDIVWGRPKNMTTADFTIDARQGKSQLNRTFKQDVSVRVVLTDVNPFLFNYRLEARGQTVAEASPASFFNLAFGFEIPKATDTRALALNPSKPSTLMFMPTGDTVTLTLCSPSADRKVEDHRLEVRRLSTLYESRVSATAAAFAKSIERITKEYRAHLATARDNRSTSLQVQARALAASDALLTIADAHQRAIEALEPSVEEYSRGVRTLQEDLNDDIEVYPDCAALRQLRIQGRSLAADTLAAKKLLVTLAGRRGEAQQLSDHLATIAKDPGKFYVAMELPRFRGPTDVEITVSRQPISATITLATTATGDPLKPVKFDTVGRHQLNVGGRGRLSTAVGVAWGDIPERSYGVIQRAVTAIDGSTTSAAFVTRTKNSPDRVVPMLFLNTNLCNRYFPLCSDLPAAFSLHAVFGVTPKALALSRFDYFAGGGFGLLGERLYLNLGLFMAPLERLNGGILPEAQLPAGQTAVSTHTTLARRFGAALSYRVAPW